MGLGLLGRGINLAKFLAQSGAELTITDLKNKKELWRAGSKLRNYRAQARKLVGLPEEDRKLAEAQLFTKLIKLGLLSKDADLDDVLGLTIEQVLNGRLQTHVYKLGLASTIKQARQFIVHGKILVNGNVVTAPSYKVAIKDKIGLVQGFKPVKRAAKKEVKLKEEPSGTAAVLAEEDAFAAVDAQKE